LPATACFLLLADARSADISLTNILLRPFRYGHHAGATPYGNGHRLKERAIRSELIINKQNFGVREKRVPLADCAFADNEQEIGVKQQ